MNKCRCMGIPATIRDSSDCPIHKEVKGQCIALMEELGKEYGDSLLNVNETNPNALYKAKPVPTTDDIIHGLEYNPIVINWIKNAKSETLNNLKKKVEEKKFPENGRGTKYGEGYNYAIENVLELIEKEKK